MPTELEQQKQESPAAEVERESAGELLRAARIERGLDEKQVADQLRITVHYIKAIESDLYEKLPGAIFARGYLRSYAKLLKLDAEDVVQRYEAATSAAKASRAQVEAAESESERANGIRWAMISVAVLAVLLIGVWMVSGSTVESTEVAVAESRDPVALAGNPTTGVDRAVAVEPTLPVPVNPAARSNPEPTIVSTEEPISPDALEATAEPGVDSAGQAIVDSDADAAPDSASSDAAAADVLADSPSLAEADPAPPAPVAEPVVETPDLNQEPDPNQESETPADTGRPEEQVAINVLEGDNGQRIIAVDANGNDVLRISFSGESWVEVNDAEQRLIYRDLRESGDILEVTGQAPFNILLGDAPLTSMRLNGTAIDVSDDIRIDNSARLTVGL